MYNNGSWTYSCEVVQIPPLLQLQKLLGKGDGGWKKVSLRHFLLTRRLWFWGKKSFWGILLGGSVKLVCRVNALCNLSHKKSQEVRVSLPGQFLSRHCFMLWITMEVEPRLAKQYKCHHCCSCKNYRGKGMEGGKKVCRCCFLLIRRSQVHEKNAFWGIL